MISLAQPPIFAQATAPVPSLTVALPTPTSIGNTLLLHVRFSPTGVPSVADSYGNRYRRLGTFNEGAAAVGFWIADLLHAGVSHTLTITAMGGAQTFEVGVVELAIWVPHPGKDAADSDIALAQLAQLYEQTSLLRLIAKAERALT